MSKAKLALMLFAAVPIPHADGQSLFERPVSQPVVRGGGGGTGKSGIAVQQTARRNGEGDAPGAAPTTPEAGGPIAAPGLATQAVAAAAPATSGGANQPAALPVGTSTQPAPQVLAMPAPVRPGQAGAMRAPALASVSLFAIEPPSQHSFNANDLITVIISEKSQAQRNQKIESKKTYSLDDKITAWIELKKLFDGRVVKAGSQNLPEVGATSDQQFTGDGKYNREDTLTDRIQARIVEVKPNGTLLLEARRSLDNDREHALAVLSGVCRSEDVTVSNTVQSNQLYDLHLDVQNTGDVKNTADKGFIARVLEGIFNF